MTKGACRDIAEQIVGGPIDENESYPTINTTSAQLVPNDPDRVVLLVLNLGANIVYMGLKATVSSSQGIQLTASGGVVAFNVKDDFTLPSREWFAVASGGASSAYVLTIRRISGPQGS